MYSKNDYRFYLENQLIHSDDFLAHYGVKGMKWKKHLKSRYDVYEKNYTDTEYWRGQENIKNGVSYDGKMIAIDNKKHPNRYVEVHKKKYADGKTATDINFGATKKERDINIGKRVNVYTTSEGSQLHIDTTKKKKSKKNKLSNLRKKYGLYRTTPKGQKLKGSKNIYVSHE